MTISGQNSSRGQDMPTSKQQPEVLNSQLNQRLLAYVAAAGAAGVGVLAMTQPANAKVVYTPADKTITVAGLNLDLNHDGVPDYEFLTVGLGTEWNVYALPHKFNKVMSNAAPLAAGVEVGPGANFGRGEQNMAFFCTCSGLDGSNGPWAGKKNQYMGFAFNIDGAAHFGWARFSTDLTGFGNITLTGYAYETIALKPIVTGDTTGSDDEESVDQPSPAASSLGALALGAARR
jgi:hypothetical protein